MNCQHYTPCLNDSIIAKPQRHVQIVKAYLIQKHISENIFAVNLEGPFTLYICVPSANDMFALVSNIKPRVIHMLLACKCSNCVTTNETICI